MPLRSEARGLTQESERRIRKRNNAMSGIPRVSRASARGHGRGQGFCGEDRTLQDDEKFRVAAFYDARDSAPNVPSCFEPGPQFWMLANGLAAAKSHEE